MITQYPELKVLYLPLNYQGGIQQPMYDAWEAVGVNLKIFDFVGQWEKTNDVPGVQKSFIKIADEFQPHLIHMQLQFTGIIQPQTLIECRKLVPGVVISNWSGDIRTDISYFAGIAPTVDHSLISSVGQLEKYREGGCHNVKYWQIGYCPKNYYPMNLSNFTYDVSFLGNNYGAGSMNSFGKEENIRLPVAQRLNSVFGNRFGLFGNGFGHLNNNKTTNKPQESNLVYNQTICPLSISNLNNISHYFSDRLLFCLASGRPTISWYYPDCEDDFVDGKEIFYVRSVDEIIEVIQKCKNDPALAMSVGQAGAEKVFQNHTYGKRVIELLKITGFSKDG